MLAISDKEFNLLASYIKQNFGIHLPPAKKTLVVGRLQNFLMQKNIQSFSEYYEKIISDKTGGAASALVSMISTNHTFFLREPDHFSYFKGTVLPYLAQVVKDMDLRIWSAGCSSGEEPYTIAMMLDEYFGANKTLWDTKILATDISPKVLDKAQTGIYSNEALVSMPKHWRLKYFDRVDEETSKVVSGIRTEVIFRKFNLITPVFPFKKKFHVIFCRNVMIYFDTTTKNSLIDAFYNSLAVGGYLFIGHSESINRENSKFKYIKPAVYRKEMP